MKKILILCCFLLLLSLTASCFEIKNNNDVEIIEEDSEEFEFLYDYCAPGNAPKYIAVKLINEQENHTYDVFCDHGFVGSVNDEMQPLSLYNVENNLDSDLFWIGWLPALISSENFDIENYNFRTAYITIIVKEANHIVGYTIIEAVQYQYAPALYYGEIATSKSFPKINDKYQSVPNEYIEGKIEELKNEEIIKEEAEIPTFKYETCYTNNEDTYIAVNIIDPEKKYKYNVSCYKGYVSAENCNDFNILYNVSNTTSNDSFWIGWKPLDYSSYNYFAQDFITIKIYENDHDGGFNYIGFIIIEVDLIDEENLIYQGKVISSISFPKINGEYQNVRRVHVNDMVLEVIENAKK